MYGLVVMLTISRSKVHLGIPIVVQINFNLKSRSVYTIVCNSNTNNLELKIIAQEFEISAE